MYNIFLFLSLLFSLVIFSPAQADQDRGSFFDQFGMDLLQISQNTTPGLFGSTETMSRQMAAFKKWQGMLNRHSTTEEIRWVSKGPKAVIPKRPQPCLISRRNHCPSDDWRELVKSLEHEDFAAMLDNVNRHMNNSPYITDIINWGISDYWSSLFQFLRRDGDCEDYAIAKYFSLKALGVDENNMRIAVVQDTNLDVPHAVLVVFEGDKTWVLDNQIPYVVREKAVLHYRPLYSINEHAWWLHRN